MIMNIGNSPKLDGTVVTEEMYLLTSRLKIPRTKNYAFAIRRSTSTKH